MSQTKIYAGSLPYGAGDEEIKEFFSKYGTIKEVNLIMDRETGRSKGFAFIDFETPESAKNALETDGTEFMERKIRVSIANSDGGSNRGRKPGNNNNNRRRDY